MAAKTVSNATEENVLRDKHFATMWDYFAMDHIYLGEHFNIEYVKTMGYNKCENLSEDFLRAAAFLQMMTYYDCYSPDIGEIMQNKAKMR